MKLIIIAAMMCMGLTDELVRSRAIVSAARDDIAAIDRQLARVECLEQTIDIMTPLLADRSKAARGDLNGDGKLDTKDLSLCYLCQGVPASQPTSPAWYADMDRDGDVDAADIEAVNYKIHGR